MRHGAFNHAMKGPIFHHDRALVPEHLTKQTIETAEFDVPFYIEPGDEDDYDGPKVFVTPDRRLVMSRTETLARADAYPQEPLGKIAVMRVALLNTESLAARDAFVADLRFMEDGGLISVEPQELDGENQGEYMRMAHILDDTITFDAFIAAEGEFDITDPNVPGAFYGNKELYPFLRSLRKRGNEVLARYIERQSKHDVTVTEDGATTEDQKTETEEKAKQTDYLTSPFSHGN